MGWVGDLVSGLMIWSDSTEWRQVWAGLISARPADESLCLLSCRDCSPNPVFRGFPWLTGATLFDSDECPHQQRRCQHQKARFPSRDEFLVSRDEFLVSRDGKPCPGTTPTRRPTSVRAGENTPRTELRPGFRTRPGPSWKHLRHPYHSSLDGLVHLRANLPPVHIGALGTAHRFRYEAMRHGGIHRALRSLMSPFGVPGRPSGPVVTVPGRRKWWQTGGSTARCGAL